MWMLPDGRRGGALVPPDCLCVPTLRHLAVSSLQMRTLELRKGAGLPAFALAPTPPLGTVWLGAGSWGGVWGGVWGGRRRKASPYSWAELAMPHSAVQAFPGKLELGIGRLGFVCWRATFPWWPGGGGIGREATAGTC